MIMMAKLNEKKTKQEIIPNEKREREKERHAKFLLSKKKRERENTD